MARIAVLCGTGMNALADSAPSSITISKRELLRVDSPWGEVPAYLLTISLIDSGAFHEIAMIQRHHGDGVVTPPHRIEHRANVYAALSFEPDVVVSINSVGSMRADLPPGHIAPVSYTHLTLPTKA